MPGGAPPPVPDAGAARDSAVAGARYDELAAGEGDHSHDCRDLTDGAKHDFDRCITEKIPNAVAFARQEGDADEVGPKDVQQMAVGDCWVMAPAAALASTRDGRALIKNAIAENKDDKGVVTSYTVTLHRPEEHWWGAKTFSEVKITVDAVYAYGHAQARLAGNDHEVWPVVLEKAFAEYLGGYNKLHQGASAARAMELLTGKEAETIRFGWMTSYGPERLTSDLAAGKLVVFDTKPGLDENGPYRLLEHHAYEAAGTVMVDGNLCVALHNPWGNPEPRPVPFDQLKNWFAAVDVGAVR